MPDDGARILLADDDENLRFMLRALLEENGYQILEASSGEDALTRFFDENPDLAIIDVHFTTGELDGFEVLHELRRDPAAGMDVPVIMLTGHSDEEHVVRGFESGADDYVAKPFNPRELLARVDSRLKRSASTRIRQRSATDFLPGSRLRGSDGTQYQIGERISRGGMGVVFKAQSLESGHHVAIKTLDNEYLSKDKERERFRLEANATMRMEHPHLPKGIDMVMDPSNCFLVMGYIEGETLASQVTRTGPLPEAEVAGLALQLCDALDYLGELGMLHRDVKPENILVSETGHATLVDFGLAKSTGPDDPHLTTDGIILGTPYYLSPEQVKGVMRLDVRSDIYSLGATMYYSLSGKKPFDGSSTVAIVNQRLFSDPLAVSVVNPTVSTTMSQIVARMMARSLDERYPGPGEVRRDIERLEPQPQVTDP